MLIITNAHYSLCPLCLMLIMFRDHIASWQYCSMLFTPHAHIVPNALCPMSMPKMPHNQVSSSPLGPMPIVTIIVTPHAHVALCSCHVMSCLSVTISFLPPFRHTIWIIARASSALAHELQAQSSIPHEIQRVSNILRPIPIGVDNCTSSLTKRNFHSFPYFRLEIHMPLENYCLLEFFNFNVDCIFNILE